MTETNRRTINAHLSTLLGEAEMSPQEEKNVDLKFGLLESVCIALNEAYFVSLVREKERGLPIGNLNLFAKQAEKDGCSPFPLFSMDNDDFSSRKTIFIGIAP